MRVIDVERRGGDAKRIYLRSQESTDTTSFLCGPAIFNFFSGDLVLLSYLWGEISSGQSWCRRISSCTVAYCSISFVFDNNYLNID